MNISQAKKQIKNAMTAYFTKDRFGNYVIPLEKQRPVFLMGPPGIGKTAIMEQIAQELGVGLISYSMTHHTRQSALGLPFIETRSYGGKEYSVSEYTMSEIIASVYDMMEETGIREGILFLDEINCVSETLAPSMLQFLQYKVFGRHRVPDGWIVVTAGNPPEYNNSVREFDIVTWDRLKRIDIEPDYQVWKEYALTTGVHASITTFLEIKKDDFYQIETSVDGKRFVTARGWSDLSEMIHLYEKHDLRVDESLIIQYLQNPRIAHEFAIYYDLFNKYKSDYQIDRILDGNADEIIKERARRSRFDERISLLGLLLDAAFAEEKSVYLEETSQMELFTVMKLLRDALKGGELDNRQEKLFGIPAFLKQQAAIRKKKLDDGKRSASLSQDREYVLHSTLQALSLMDDILKKSDAKDPQSAFMLLKKEFEGRTEALKNHADMVKRMLSNLFGFCEEVFKEGQEMVIVVTEMTVNDYSSHFISRYGCEEYFRHNRELLFYERQMDLITELSAFDI